MNAKSTRTHGLLLAIFVCIMATAAAGATLPILCDFDADTPCLPPATGGTDQPETIAGPSLGTIMVESLAYGIASQPCVIDITDAGDWAYLRFSFDTVTSGNVRVEATASFSALVDGFFLQAGTFTDFVAARLMMTSAGEIKDFHGTVLGTYVIGVPFCVRMDIDVDTDSYSVQIDSEMDGFSDNPATTGLQYVNNPSVITDIGSCAAFLSLYAGNASGAAIAFDDISIKTFDPSPAEYETWGGLKLRFR